MNNPERGTHPYPEFEPAVLARELAELAETARRMNQLAAARHAARARALAAIPVQDTTRDE